MTTIKKKIKALERRHYVKEQQVDFQQIENHLNRAHKDLETARANLKIDTEASYHYAYLAMLRSGRALMFLNGYRPADGRQHKTVVEFSGLVLGNRFEELVDIFDRMRKRRNQFTYAPGRAVSLKEANEAIEEAKNFTKQVFKLVRKENPQLELF